MTRNRFEFIDDVLCGVDATPERVTIARSLLEDDFKKTENSVRVPKGQYELMILSIDSLHALISQAGLDFLNENPDDGHEKMSLAIALLDRMGRVAKQWK